MMLRFALAAIAAMALVCSCEKETASIEISEENPVEVVSSHVYSVSINASERAISTRGLTMTGNTLNAEWRDGEKVKVFGMTKDSGPSGSLSLGTLTAVVSDGSAVLSGELDLSAYDAEIASWGIDGVNDTKSLIEKGLSPMVYLIYPDYPFSFEGQTGEFDYLSKFFDKAWVRMVISEIDSDKGTVKLLNSDNEEKADFFNPASIFRFSFVDRRGEEIIPKTVTISGSQLFSEVSFDGGTKGDVVINCPDGKSDNMVFVALMEGSSDGTLQIIVEDQDGKSWLYVYYNESIASYSDPYTLWFNSDPDFSASDTHRGEYRSWIIKMDMAKDLSTLTSDYTASDGEILYGTLPNNINLSIADKATVVLKGVTVGERHSLAGINCLGDATIILKGENSVRSSSSYIYPAVQPGPEGTLTIKGDGSLTAIGVKKFEPGIGGSTTAHDVGNVIIESGTITAIGGPYAPGIGTCGLESDRSNPCTMGDITINGGTVIAKGCDGAVSDDTSGEQAAAGIGSGMYGKCGNITISGGIVSAASTKYGAGIGTGRNPSKCGYILISGGTVTASTNLFAAAIGTGFIYSEGGSSYCGDVTITGNVTSLTAKVGTILGDGAVFGKGGKEGATNEAPYAVTGTVTVDGVTDPTRTSEFPNLNSSYTSSNDGGTLNVVWTLTKK